MAVKAEIYYKFGATWQMTTSNSDWNAGERELASGSMQSPNGGLDIPARLSFGLQAV
jgi:hypothetical protein